MNKSCFAESDMKHVCVKSISLHPVIRSFQSCYASYNRLPHFQASEEFFSSGSMQSTNITVILCSLPIQL